MFSSGTTEGTVTGGQFAFAEADLVKIRDNWLDLARSYQKSVYNAKQMSRISPPAEDFASRFQVIAANRSGESYQRYIEHNREYCLRQAQLFQDALDDYRGVEHTNIIEINNSGGQDGPRPGV
jgi:hypothetical protein